MYKDYHVSSFCLTISIRDIVLSEPKLSSVCDTCGQSFITHESRSTIYPVLNYRFYIVVAKEIYYHIKFPCTSFLHSCTLVIFLYLFFQCIFHALNVRVTITAKGKSVVLRCKFIILVSN